MDFIKGQVHAYQVTPIVYSYYALYDLDNNGLPELLLTDAKDTVRAVATIVNGREELIAQGAEEGYGVDIYPDGYLVLRNRPAAVEKL